MRKKNSILATTLAAAMILTALPTGLTSVKAEDTVPEGTIDTVSMGDGNADAYVYVPTSSSKLGKRSCTSPIIMVFGDEDYTAATAKSTAEDSGLAEIADEEGAPIFFLSSNGASWTSEDAATYKTVIGKYTDSSTNTYVDGKYTNPKTGAVSYAGTTERIYVYAEGSGADFVAQNLTQEVTDSVTYGDGVTIAFDRTATAISLYNASVVPTGTYNKYDIPVYSVNGITGTDTAIAALNPTYNHCESVTSSTTSGFDADLIASSYESFVGTLRRQSGVVIEIPDYEALGITETTETATVTNADGDEASVEYLQYVPSTINTETAAAGSVPLVMIYHGGGNTAEFEAWASEWPIIGKDNNLMVVSVNNHTSFDATAMVDLLSQLEEKYPCIDTTRIYATGFSMGSIKSWDLMEEYGNLFAGVAPMDGSEAAASDTVDCITPCFYVAGDASPLPELPHQAGSSNDIDSRISWLLAKNQVIENYTYDSTKGVWGIAADSTDTIDNDTFTDCTLNLNYFKSVDGNVYTVLCDVSNQSHEVYAANSYAAWDFLKQFSRNADGSISIADNEPTGSVDTVSMGEGKADAYVYVPTSSASLGKRSCTSPIIMVFGDEDYTAESAKTAAEESGLAEIADEEGAPVFFLSSNGDSWTADDAATYKAVIGKYSDSSTSTYVNGKTSAGVYAGTTERIYIYAEGSGADFVAQNLTQEVTDSVTYGDGVTIAFDRTATAISLYNATVVPSGSYNKYDIPVYSVNGPAGTEAAIKALNPSYKHYKAVSSDTTDGFDKATLLESYDSFVGTLRRQSGVVIEIPNYASLGITETDVTALIDGNRIDYIQYVPSEINTATAEEGSVPLVMIYHGGGNTAEFEAWASEWPIIGKENGFMVVSINNHTSYDATTMVDLLKYLEAKYSCIDTTRIYATGFSMGSIKSWNLMEQYGNLFAGVAPMDGSEAAAKSTVNCITPCFYVAGDASPLPELPHQAGSSNNIDSRIKWLLAKNQVMYDYSYDADQGVWGIEADYTKTIKNTTFTDCTLNLNYFTSKDGNVYTVLCDVSNQSHEVYAANSYAAWDFLSQFSRMEDGSIAIDLSDATVKVSSATYTGSALKPSVTVKLGSKTLVKGTDYNVVYKNNTNAGTATVIVKGRGIYTGSVSKTFTIAKASASLTVSPASKSFKVADLKKAAKTYTLTVKGAKGKVTYTSSSKSVTVSSTGKVTVKKGTKKGTYKITVKSAETANYKAATKTVLITVK